MQLFRFGIGLAIGTILVGSLYTPSLFGLLIVDIAYLCAFPFLLEYDSKHMSKERRETLERNPYEYMKKY